VHVINKAGRLRMLSQRIVKSYVLLASEAAPQAAVRELADSVLAFERQLGELKASAFDADTRQVLAASEREWTRFRNLALGPCARTAVPEVRSAGERLLQAAERTTQSFAKNIASAVATLINLAGRQRMLSQRIAKAHLLLAEKYDEGAARQELTQACVDFGRALGELRACSANTADLREELAAVARTWRTLLDLVRRDSGARDLVLAAAEEILQRMERITSLYER
jgi:nitrate/nitrite-specific signal transduction histidine kinase